MIVEERQKLILEELKRSPGITVRELAKMFFVSEPTIRRDLTDLESKNLITKFYGGVSINLGSKDEPIPFYDRKNEKIEAKMRICEMASSYVSDGMVVMLDGSSTSYYMVPHLAKFKNIIVVTSGGKTAVALAEAGIKTFATGGQMIPNSFSFYGAHAASFIKNINADILFFSVAGVSNSGIMSDKFIEGCYNMQAMIESSKTKVLLCDSSKFGKYYFYNVGDIRDLDYIISEKELP